MKKITIEVAKTTYSPSPDGIRIPHFPKNEFDIIMEEANKPENLGLKVYSHKKRQECKSIPGTEKYWIIELDSYIAKQVDKDYISTGKFDKGKRPYSLLDIEETWYLDIYFQ